MYQGIENCKISVISKRATILHFLTARESSQCNPYHSPFTAYYNLNCNFSNLKEIVKILHREFHIKHNKHTFFAFLIFILTKGQKLQLFMYNCVLFTSYFSNQFLKCLSPLANIFLSQKYIYKVNKNKERNGIWLICYFINEAEATNIVVFSEVSRIY